MTQLNVEITPSIGIAPLIASPPVGQRIGSWLLVERVAQGSLAQIWRARPADASAELPASYVLKMLLPRWQHDPAAVSLLEREATVGRLVSHPHLIPVLSASLAHPPRYLLMPWLSGRSLAERLAHGWRPDLPTALWIVRQVAEALEALHTAGWTHGDIKPSNIFLSSQCHATLLDLGFARRVDEARSMADRCVLGTCNYLAPEAITSAWPDIRSDVYSLGVVLFEILTGRVPFAGTSLSELVAQHRQNRPPDLRKLMPRLPPGVACLVAVMLAKESLRRPQTPRELINQVAGLEILTFAERSGGSHTRQG